MKLEFINESLF